MPPRANASSTREPSSTRPPRRCRGLTSQQEARILADELELFDTPWEGLSVVELRSLLRDLPIDLLVDLPDGTSLFDRAELKSALEELLPTRVDLIRRRNLKPAIKASVEAEAIALR